MRAFPFLSFFFFGKRKKGIKTKKRMEEEEIETRKDSLGEMRKKVF